MSARNWLRVQCFKFYYAYVRLLNIVLPTIKLNGKVIRVNPDVYKPLEHEHSVATYCHPGSRGGAVRSGGDADW